MDNRGKNQTGGKNPYWKGGKSKTSKGYIIVRMPDHPRASPNGYVFEHILVLETKLGRPLDSYEDSHHINEIKIDNRPENLEAKIHGKHTALHWMGKHHTALTRLKMSQSRIRRLSCV